VGVDADGSGAIAQHLPRAARIQPDDGPQQDRLCLLAGKGGDHREREVGGQRVER
jgi:hypothetical protein